jgi:catalase
MDGEVRGADGELYTVDRALPTVASVLYDAVLLPGGPVGTPPAAADPDATRFVRDAYRHGKPIGALGSGVGILSSLEPEELRLSTEFHRVESDRGVVTETSPGPAGEEFLDAFVAAIAAHRHWGRLPTRH